MKRSTLDLLTGREHQRPQCLLFTRMAESAELWITPTGILIDLKTHQPESTFYLLRGG